MKKLGFGLMRLPLRDAQDAGSIDIEKTKELVDLFLEQGCTYFDTAWGYCDFQSENAARQALTERYPRDRYTLADKLHIAFVKTPEDRDRIFFEQLRKTGVTYFDYYLLHAVGDGNIADYERLDCFAWLREKKAAGLVRHMGCSFHGTPALLDRLLTDHPELEFVQLQINYLDWESRQVRARECYETVARHGKSVVIMEPVKGGSLAKLPPEAEALLKARDPQASAPSWAMRFAGSLEKAMVVLSGMNAPEQVLENARVMDGAAPLSEEEKALLAQAAAVIRAQDVIDCTGCAYCADGCPRHIPIPQLFQLYNAQQRGEDVSGRYEELTRERGKPSECLACGQCEGVCPQHLPVIRKLKLVDRTFAD